MSRSAARGAVGLLSSEPLRPLMAGIGIRYLELARRLAGAGLRVALVHPGPLDQTPDARRERRAARVRARRARRDSSPTATRRWRRGSSPTTSRSSCRRAAARDRPLRSLAGREPALHRDARARSVPQRPRSWVLQLSRGDFFLCASEEQRDFYLGFLTALGRVNPERLRLDADLRGLIDVVPFGVPGPAAAASPVARRRRRTASRRLLFGGLYDWYDPWTLLDALDSLLDLRWRLLFARNPNAGATPQALLAAVEQWVAARGGAGATASSSRLGAVRAPLRPAARRRPAGLAAPPTLETRLSLRTRFLDALAAGCPVVTSDGGTVARLLRESGGGWVVPRGDAAALARVLREVLESPGGARASAPRSAAPRRESLAWSKRAGAARAVRRRARRRPDARSVRVPTRYADSAATAGASASAGACARCAPSSRPGAAGGRSEAPAAGLGRRPELERPRAPREPAPVARGARAARRRVGAAGPRQRLDRRHRRLGALRVAARATDRERDATSASPPAINDWSRRRAATRSPSSTTTPASLPAGCASWWRRSPRARRRGRGLGLSLDWEGERLDFGRGVMTFDGHAFQLDYRRPLERARVPEAGDELLFACGGNMLMWRDAFLELGGFDQDYFAYLEDVDLGWRSWSAGWRVLHAPGAARSPSRLGDQRSAGSGPPRLPLRAQRVPDRLQELRGGALGAHDAGGDADAAVAARDARRREQPRWLAAHGRSLRRVDRETAAATGRARRESAAGGAGVSSGGSRAAGPAGATRRALDSVRRALRSVERGGRAPAATAPVLTDERTLAHHRAVWNLLGNLDRAAAKRARVQAMRRRSDAEIFARFPLYVVPTYPGDAALFRSVGLELLARARPARSALDPRRGHGVGELSAGAGKRDPRRPRSRW